MTPAVVEQDTMKLLLQEAIIQRSLVHDHVCPLIDVYEDEDNLYMILEFIGGQDLFDSVLAEGALKESSAAAIIKQLLEALKHCHKEGVIHRDVKPENILLCKQPAARAPTPFLADFGLAMAADVAHYAPQAVVGTEGYISLEASDGKYSPASDIWSVGKVLCFMLFGKHVDNCHMEEWAQFSPEARSFVSGLLCENINNRLSATEALEHPWLSIGDTSNTRATTIRNPLPEGDQFKNTPEDAHMLLVESPSSKECFCGTALGLGNPCIASSCGYPVIRSAGYGQVSSFMFGSCMMTNTLSKVVSVDARSTKVRESVAEISEVLDSHAIVFF